MTTAKRALSDASVNAVRNSHEQKAQKTSTSSYDDWCKAWERRYHSLDQAALKRVAYEKGVQNGGSRDDLIHRLKEEDERRVRALENQRARQPVFRDVKAKVTEAWHNSPAVKEAIETMTSKEVQRLDQEFGYLPTTCPIEGPERLAARETRENEAKQIALACAKAKLYAYARQMKRAGQTLDINLLGARLLHDALQDWWAASYGGLNTDSLRELLRLRGLDVNDARLDLLQRLLTDDVGRRKKKAAGEQAYAEWMERIYGPTPLEPWEVDGRSEEHKKPVEEKVNSEVKEGKPHVYRTIDVEGQYKEDEYARDYLYKRIQVLEQKIVPTDEARREEARAQRAGRAPLITDFTAKCSLKARRLNLYARDNDVDCTSERDAVVIEAARQRGFNLRVPHDEIKSYAPSAIADTQTRQLKDEDTKSHYGNLLYINGLVHDALITPAANQSILIMYFLTEPGPEDEYEENFETAKARLRDIVVRMQRNGETLTKWELSARLFDLLIPSELDIGREIKYAELFEEELTELLRLRDLPFGGGNGIWWSG